MLIDLSFIFFYSFASLFIVRKIAKRVGLVDKPSLRKQHQGAIPIAGGIAVCIILSNILYTRPDIVPDSDLLIFCIVSLALIGAFDDRFDLNILFRFTSQIMISIVFMYESGLQLDYLGDLFGSGVIKLQWLGGSIMTIIAILGAINAFNMIDGLDGLLGTLSIITFASLSILLAAHKQPDTGYFCIIISVTVLPYIFMNLGYFGRQRKVFMGDAGSMMIGFIVVWLLLSSTQGSLDGSISPMTALWLIAIPLMDMTATIIRRLVKKRSPFLSDQDHIHYILQDLGFSPSQTLFIISSLACILAIIGVASELLNASDPFMFYAFLSCFAVYFFTLSHLKKRTALSKTP
ncbi:UDP-N-acetylglucosamine--undecaprenyl-phosphate N-acetylglucosaminephosphotransferase [Marinomonas shanghaiensis]|uniref:UDP-N-acetylglucosamine--undecaprenyl-phosphate N-acetylglucosaminephosphotransferase n=1 Tax=Marinomonas shanghaiensis TaxID=2202418 RepID=UPI003A8CAD11